MDEPEKKRKLFQFVLVNDLPPKKRFIKSPPLPSLNLLPEDTKEERDGQKERRQAEGRRDRSAGAVRD